MPGGPEMRARALWLALAVLGAGLAVQSARLEAATAAKARAEAALRGHEEAARFRAREAIRQAEAAAVDRELQEGVGADVALSEYLRAGAGRVWP